MKGTYITLQGKCVKVLNFDSEHKMAYTDFGEGDIHWAGEPEYKEWAAPTSIPDIPAQIFKEPLETLQEEIINEEPISEIIIEETEDKPKKKKPVKGK